MYFANITTLLYTYYIKARSVVIGGIECSSITVLTCTSLTALYRSNATNAATGKSILSDGGDIFLLINSDPYSDKKQKSNKSYIHLQKICFKKSELICTGFS